MLRAFGPKSDKIGAYRAAFVHQVPFEKDFSSAPRVVNEVVLGTLVNKGKKRKGRRGTACDPSYGTATRATIATTSESNWLPAPLVSSPMASVGERLSL